MILVLKCPKCGNRMKYQAIDGVLARKVKRCVYCGHSYKVGKAIVN